MIAIIETGGKQILVKKNISIYIEKIAGKKGDTISFRKVLLVGDNIGKPLVKNGTVKGVIEKQGKAKKIVVFRHNPKSTFKRKVGIRQPYTRVKITEIGVKNVKN